MKVAFFGTPPFAAKVLEYLLSKGAEIVAIVTRTDKPKGRSKKLVPPAVKAFAQEHVLDIPLYQPVKASAPEFVETLAKHKPDLCIVVAYGEIMRQNLLDLAPLGCLNVHASLLPKYRGAAPIQRAIIDGEKKSGIAIMEMVLELDAGDVFAMRETPITDEMNAADLAEKLCTLGCEALYETVQKIDEGTAEKVPQDPSGVTYAHKITSETCHIDWSKSADEIHNLIRGVAPRPGAWCMIGGKRLKILRSKVSDQSGAPGETITYEKDRWTIACGQKSLDLLEVQPEGKRPMLVADYIRGNSLH